MSRRLIKVQGNPSLRRDSKTGAILSINKEDLEKAKLKKKSQKEKDRKIKNLENEVSELKALVTQILENK